LIDIMYIFSNILFLVFFFFQAEDGIRDLIVTGVQTCALPISACRQSPLESSTPPGPVRRVTDDTLGCPTTWRGFERASWSDRRRSEERRVGKECRSRWGLDQ